MLGVPREKARSEPVGRGPAWSNSLFEDNAQFGLGMRVSSDKLHGYAMELVAKAVANEKTPAAMKACLEKIQKVDQFDAKGTGVEEMRALVKELLKVLRIWMFGSRFHA